MLEGNSQLAQDFTIISTVFNTLFNEGRQNERLILCIQIGTLELLKNKIGIK